MEQFLRMDARAKDPDRLVDVGRKRGGEKRLGRLGDVGKSYGPTATPDQRELARDRFGARGEVEKLRGRRLFHGEYSPNR